MKKTGVILTACIVVLLLILVSLQIGRKMNEYKPMFEAGDVLVQEKGINFIARQYNDTTGSPYYLIVQLKPQLDSATAKIYFLGYAFYEDTRDVEKAWRLKAIQKLNDKAIMNLFGFQRGYYREIIPKPDTVNDAISVDTVEQTTNTDD